MRRFVRMAVVGLFVASLMLSPTSASAEGPVAGTFPDRTFSVTRSPPGGPRSDTLTVDLLPTASGEWWVTAESLAGSMVTVEVWRNDDGVLTLESSSRLRAVGEESTRTPLKAGLTYVASFTPFGKAGTSVLREHFSVPAPPPGEIQWIRQFGFSQWGGEGIAVDASGVYVAGYTHGTLPGQTSAGVIDAFVRKYDVDRNEVWTRQFGTSGSDGASGIAVDASGVYVTGWTSGTFPGQTSAGAFVRKYDLDGNEVWTRQFGGLSPAIAVNPSGVYVAGDTYGALPGQTSAGGSDAFVRKYDVDGNEVWTRQFGSSWRDGASGIAVDASGVYVTGWVEGGSEGALPGQTSAGGQDAFVRKYDVDGNELWTRQFGTSGWDGASGIAVDASGVYVTGFASGALPGETTDGAFVRKYDVDGNELWTRQFGTSGWDGASGIAVDASGVYVIGWTADALDSYTALAFVRKYDLDGNEVWTRQFGFLCSSYSPGGGSLSPLYPMGIAVDASGVYVAGTMWGCYYFGTVPFVRKYDAQGNEVWTRLSYTASGELTAGIAVDASGVYVTGSTEGALPGQTSSGSYDAFVRKYDVNGNEVWTRQFGSSWRDIALGIAVDASGVYVTGSTEGALPGQTSSGSYDAFVRKYDVDGNEVWTRQFGTSGSDGASGIAVDASGVYATGWASGTFPGQTTAGAFVRKYDAQGNEIWTRQFGTSESDSASAIVVDASGIAVDASGVYVTGRTNGAFPGQTSAGGWDAFVREYDVDGNEVWTRQFGSSEDDWPGAIAVDAFGVYVAGWTDGVFPGQTSAGERDAFVAKLTP